MGFVQKAVARLDEKEKLDKLLEELGKAHFYYGAPKKYIDVSELKKCGSSWLTQIYTS